MDEARTGSARSLRKLPRQEGTQAASKAARVSEWIDAVSGVLVGWCTLTASHRLRDLLRAMVSQVGADVRLDLVVLLLDCGELGLTNRARYSGRVNRNTHLSMKIIQCFCAHCKSVVVE
jgi:hypothetical protein